MGLNISPEQYTANLLNFIERCQRHHGTATKLASVHKLSRLAGDPSLPQRVNNWKKGVKRLISDYTYLAKIDAQGRKPHVLKHYLENSVTTDSFTRTKTLATIKRQHKAVLVTA
jgi:hypothetical protein